MRNDQRLFSRAFSVTLLWLAALFTTGCESPGSDDGRVIDTILLPTDTLLNLACVDVGINDEQCVLEDPENPFAFTPISEFNTATGQPGNKFDLADQIPAGPTGAKARFYLWATALARFQSGENQYFTALALHELWTYNSDPLIQEQALRAYRSQLDNFFGSVIVGGDGLQFPVGINELTASNLYRTDATGFRRLTESPAATVDLLLQWRYEYRPDIPPNGLVIPLAGP